MDLVAVEQLLDIYQNSYLQLKRPSLNDINKAKEIMHSCRDVGMPSFYDAIYHAIAINNNATFITADKKYYNKVPSSHILLLEDFVTTEG